MDRCCGERRDLEPHMDKLLTPANSRRRTPPSPRAAPTDKLTLSALTLTPTAPPALRPRLKKTCKSTLQKTSDLKPIRYPRADLEHNFSLAIDYINEFNKIG
ncbi:unnamed protein product, partial [Brenthis ino]